MLQFSAVLQNSFRFAVFPKRLITFNPMQYVKSVSYTHLLPIAFTITFFSARIQEYFNCKSVAANVALESGVQECIESLQDLKSNNAEESYLKGLDKKIDRCV